jgi:sulfate transport system permease protein
VKRDLAIGGALIAIGAGVTIATRDAAPSGGRFVVMWGAVLFGIVLVARALLSRTAPARRSALPGFGLSMGITITYLSLLVLLPLSMVFIKATQQSPEHLWKTISSDRALASYWLSLKAALIAASVNVVFGVILAWVLVRYRFWGKRVIDAMIDLPFALPTAVAGIALTATWAPTGWLGQYLAELGIQGAYSQVGVVIALTFVGLPFVVRTVQPVLESIDPRVEEAAATLGASRLQTVVRVILPQLVPAILTGFALAFARAIGEYGSVVFISGNMPMRTEITPLLVMTKLEQYDYAGATALAGVMLIASFAILIAINSLASRSQQLRRPPPAHPLPGDGDPEIAAAPSVAQVKAR